jgi:hypothetical protein
MAYTTMRLLSSSAIFRQNACTIIASVLPARIDPIDFARNTNIKLPMNFVVDQTSIEVLEKGK